MTHRIGALWVHIKLWSQKRSTSLQNSLFEHNSKSRSVCGRRKNRSTSLQNSLFEHNSKSRSVSGRRKNDSTSLQNSLFEHNSVLVVTTRSLRGYYAVTTQSLRGYYAVIAVTTGRYGHYVVGRCSL